MNDTETVTLTAKLPEKLYSCDFCGETERLASFLVKATNDTCICDKCVEAAAELLRAQRARILPITQG